MSIKLEYPFTAEKVRALRLGARVSLAGTVFTGRDKLHKFLHEGGKIPVDLQNGAIFHCGPIVLKKADGWQVQSAGPTTSFRQDAYMPGIIERNRVRVIIGKGGMGEAVRKACRQYGCVYLQCVGGSGAFTAQAVKKVVNVHFLREFGQADAMWEFIMSDLEAVVGIDARGGSLFRRIEIRSRAALKPLLK